MGCLEVSGAVRHIYIYVIRRLKVNIKIDSENYCFKVGPDLSGYGQ